MESINGRMVTGSRGAGTIVLSTGKELISLRMAMSTQAIMLLESQTDKGSINGKMDLFTKVNSKTV
jgi:hypothetical protein